MHAYNCIATKPFSEGNGGSGIRDMSRCWACAFEIPLILMDDNGKRYRETVVLEGSQYRWVF
jgi:hypothetical protein